MKRKLLCGVLTLTMMYFCIGQQNIISNRYLGDRPGILFDGSNHPMLHFKTEMIELKPGSSYRSIQVKDEHLIISKSGRLMLSSEKIKSALSPGSIAVMTKGNRYKLVNKTADHASFYVISYVARDLTKGSDTAHSFVRLMEDVPFKAHDRGGVRSYFDIHSSQSKRLELHLTTLNPGFKSHDPHTHTSEEMIIMIEGNTKMLIGNQYYTADNDGVYYVESMDLHGIENTGTSACSYFAFQWE